METKPLSYPPLLCQKEHKDLQAKCLCYYDVTEVRGDSHFLRTSAHFLHTPPFSIPDYLFFFLLLLSLSLHCKEGERMRRRKKNIKNNRTTKYGDMSAVLDQ